MGDKLLLLMKKCWRLNPDERCSFEDIIKDLEAILATFHVRPVTRANSYDPDGNISDQGIRRNENSSLPLAPYVSLGAHEAFRDEFSEGQRGLAASLSEENECGGNMT